MTGKHLAALIAVSIAAVLLGSTGCGSSSSAEPTISKKEFLKKADIVCEQASREQGELAVAYIKKHPRAEEQDYAEPAGIPPLEKQIRQLRALGTPAQDRAELVAYLDQFDTDLAAAKEEPLSMLSEADNPFAQTIKLGKKYGFNDCVVLP